MLDYHLVENLMTAAPDDYMAQVVNVRSYSNEEIAELMLKRGSLLTKADILAVLEVYGEVITDTVEDGGGIHTPLFVITPSIAGVFNGAGDSFDEARHSVKANINPGTSVREASRKIKTKKVQVADPVPYIVEVKDIVSGSVNDRLTPGGVIEIRGNRLKFIDASPTNGIFLLREGAADIRLTVIVENKPGRLIAMLPSDLLKGAYALEVRTNYSQGGTHESKQLKTGRFIKILAV
ncbi:MAG: DUF4469 domain-containing protein [Tannerella sp.]|jgi:hypothetical protein|nr:DUF4469 domain-containing protein [Tannerella sp.]